MKQLRFTIEKNYSERDAAWFYDVIDHHPLRDKRVIGYYSAEPSWEGDRNYGYAAAKEMADDLNEKYGKVMLPEGYEDYNYYD